jgi:hypothetical protein
MPTHVKKRKGNLERNEMVGAVPQFQTGVDRQRSRLPESKFDELLPVWIEAKRMARSAQKSRETSRKIRLASR